MCGIAGYWSVDPIATENLAVFADMLEHRGPDGFGYLSADAGRLGLGHRRLTILDPDPRSRQPMQSRDGRFAIVFNGEIYNFLEVRDELRARGHAFRTESDTEVIVHAYAEWGPNARTGSTACGPSSSGTISPADCSFRGIASASSRS